MFSVDSRYDEEWYLPTADSAGELYVREIGEGEPIVVLHGGFARGQHASLIAPLRHLSEHYRLVFYDQRGALRSPVPPDSYSLLGHISDVDQLRNALQADRLNLIGHSAGGNIAMAYLDQFPERVGGLVLLSASPPLPRRALTTSERRDRTAFSRFVHRPEVAAEWACYGLDRDETILDARARTRLWRIRFAAANCYHVDRWRQLPAGGIYFNEGVPALKDAPDSWNYLEALSRRAATTHVIVGDHDHVDMTGEHWRTAASTVENLELHVIDKAGHFSWIDQPSEFRGIIDIIQL